MLQRDRTFVLYYTVTDAASGRQCISAATSSSAEGPYADESTAPLVCPVDRGGAIDPSPFVDDDGRAFLLWKVDGNCCGSPVSLQVQELDGSGTALVGPPGELLAPAQPWEAGLVEAPTMVRAPDGGLHLFYSANDWRTSADADGDLHLVFHAWPPDKVGYDAGGHRRLFGAELRFDGGVPVAV